MGSTKSIEGEIVPIYEFECTKCRQKVEILCKSDELLLKEQQLICSKCGEKLFKRKLAPFVTHFNYT